MRETVSNKTQFSLFDVLLDWIVYFIFGDFLLGVRPTRDFDNHVEDLRTCTGRRCKKRNIMPWRDNNTILLKVNSMFECVWCA
jgi:hypothetical protein